MIPAHHLVYGMNGYFDSVPFVIKIKTDNSGTSASNQFTLPLQSAVGLTYDFFVDWGDGEFTSHNTSANITHTFPSAGIYEIRIYGKFEKIYFNNSGDKNKLLKVIQGGDYFCKYPDQTGAFFGCGNLTEVLNLDVSAVTRLTLFFYNCSKLNSDFSNWDVSNCTQFDGLFYNCASFNSDLSNWDVSRATNMSTCFYICSSFNSDLSNWDVSSVINFSHTFYGCSKFNSDLSNWDVSSVTNFSNMFVNCYSFNSDLSSWDVSNVTTFSGMFWNCQLFNSDLGSWNVSKATNLGGMFYGCINFTSDLTSWNVSNVTNFGSFMWNGERANSTDISQWNFNKNAIFATFWSYKSGSQLTALQFDVFLQKVATAVIGTGRTQTNKVIQITRLQCTSVGETYYNQLLSDGWTFPGGIIII